jgi:hypothetical protein
MRLTNQRLGYGSHSQLHRFIIVHIASYRRTIQQWGFVSQYTRFSFEGR